MSTDIRRFDKAIITSGILSSFDGYPLIASHSLKGVVVATCSILDAPAGDCYAAEIGVKGVEMALHRALTVLSVNCPLMYQLLHQAPNVEPQIRVQLYAPLDALAEWTREMCGSAKIEVPEPQPSLGSSPITSL